MSKRYCRVCGGAIPRQYETPDGRIKKTNKKRKTCFNCSPMKDSLAKPRPIEYRTERKKRKAKLVKMKGGKCTICGYSNSLQALSFHHRDPSQKKFDISSNGGLMKDWNVVVAEANKCDLLCLNCHAELHNRISSH
jgi:hypothetical protein